MNLSRAKIPKKSKGKYSYLIIPAIIVELVLIIYFLLPLLLSTPTVIVKIKSDSMLPEIRKGNIVIISGRDSENSYINKIIAFYDPTQGKIIIHRAIKEEEDCYITKGDNNDDADFFMPCRGYILGKIIYKI